MRPLDEWATHIYAYRLSRYLHDQADLLTKHRRADIAPESPNAIELAARALRPPVTAEDVEISERELFVKREREFQELGRRWIVNLAADCPTYLRQAEDRVKFDCAQRVEEERCRRDTAMELGILGRYFDRKKQKIVQSRKNTYSEQ
jgi:hypothetical protein